jgi:hypothetical protein
MGLATESSKKRQKEQEIVSEKIKKTRLTFSDLVIPIASGIVLIILSFAVFVPMVSAAFDYLDEIKVTNQNIEQLEKLDKQLNLLDETQLNEDVLTARKVIPNKLLVTSFVYYIDELAREKGLEIQKLEGRDAQLTGVSGPLEYAGEYIAVVAFLDEVQDVSPYIINLQNVEVSSNEEQTWSISLDVSGYYIAENTQGPDIYDPFQLYTEYNDVVEIFRNKAAEL